MDKDIKYSVELAPGERYLMISSRSVENEHRMVIVCNEKDKSLLDDIVESGLDTLERLVNRYCATELDEVLRAYEKSLPETEPEFSLWIRT